MDGITPTRHIVQSFPATRIVIVTQYDDVGLRTSARETGACGYALKDDLLEVLRFLDAPAQPGRRPSVAPRGR